MPNGMVPIIEANQAYLALSPGRQALQRLKSALETHKPAAVLWLGEADEPHLKQVRDIAQAQDAAVLIVDAVEKVIELGLDGVHLSREQSVGLARAALGDDYIIGVRAVDRHMAMEAAEAGAHYVMFATLDNSLEPDWELLNWWLEMMEVPCVGTVSRPGDFRLIFV